MELYHGFFPQRFNASVSEVSTPWRPCLNGMAPINSPTGHNWDLQLVTGISMQHGFQLFPAGGRIAHHLAAIFRQFGMVWMFFMEKKQVDQMFG